MPEIVLSTLNAAYAHSAFGLRYLLANLGTLRQRACIVEFEVSRRSVDILEEILARRPRIVALGVYIWNVAQTTQLVGQLKRVRPDICVILGGPEVSYETQGQQIVELADYVITGEADLVLGELCAKVLAGERGGAKIINAQPPALEQVALPYELYDERDIAQRVIYVEASRGCPFECEFCLSALDVPVRAFGLEAFLAGLEGLLERGARQFKFVDRTFNLNVRTGQAILEFFLERMRPGMFLHFEMIPDRLPTALRETIARFAPGTLQFEVGVQTFNPEVAQLISRRQDNDKLADNLNYLREHTGVHVHADLIVGLPGEDVESFGRGLDRLMALGPQEIQIGLLKRLRGTPITRHDSAWGMVYCPDPPYEILQTRSIDFATMQRVRRMARYWDLLVNSGNFRRTAPLLWREGSVFGEFMKFSDWLYARTQRSHGIALAKLYELVFGYLTQTAGVEGATAAAALGEDRQRGGHSDWPAYLRAYDPPAAVRGRGGRRAGQMPARQARHLA